MGMRLDRALVERGLITTRARAQEAVRNGLVQVDGKVAAKPSVNVGAEAVIDVDADATVWVSRAAHKLRHGLDLFGWDVTGATALDVGASTGGFTQVLLRAGAARVYAVDVGHDQLVAELAADPRVVSLEGVNAKDLGAALVPEPVDLIVSDVSFIGLEKALPAALALGAPKARLMALIKPQFEVGPGRVGKGGIVRDAVLHDEVCERIRAWLESEGWQVTGIAPSPIEGSDGNREFLIGAERA